MFKLLTPFLLLLARTPSEVIINKNFSEFMRNYPTIERKLTDNSPDDKKKITAFNVHSGKIIGKVAQKAVDNSPALVTAKPNPTASIVVPTPIQEPSPTYIIVPISETPFPTPPFRCTDRMCPMIACVDNLEVQSMKMPPMDDCPPCPCYPPPIYLEAR